MNRKTAVAGIVLSSLLEMLCERRSHSLPLLLGHARVIPVGQGRGAESDVAARPLAHALLGERLEGLALADDLVDPLDVQTGGVCQIVHAHALGAATADQLVPVSA